MWTKFLNALGIETKAQQRETERMHFEALRQARVNQAMQRYNDRANKVPTAVIKSTDVPTRRPAPLKKPSQQVRMERYGYSEHDAYLTPGFNNYYEPTVLMPAIHFPALETTSYAPVSDSPRHSDSYDSSGGSSDSGGYSGSTDSAPSVSFGD
jgi:hypothetical protein